MFSLVGVLSLTALTTAASLIAVDKNPVAFNDQFELKTGNTNPTFGRIHVVNNDKTGNILWLFEPWKVSDAAALMRLASDDENLNGGKHYESEDSKSIPGNNEIEMRALPKPIKNLLPKLTQYSTKAVEIAKRLSDPQFFKDLLMNNLGFSGVLDKVKAFLRSSEVKLATYKPIVQKYGKPLRPFLEIARNVFILNLKDLSKTLSSYVLIRAHPTLYLPIAIIFAVSAVLDVILYAALNVIDSPKNWLEDILMYALEAIWSVAWALLPF